MTNENGSRLEKALPLIRLGAVIVLLVLGCISAAIAMGYSLGAGAGWGSFSILCVVSALRISWSKSK